MKSIRKISHDFFKRHRDKTTPAGSDESPEMQREKLGNPYTNARRTWNIYTGEIIKSRMVWQFIALISALLALSSIAGLYYIGSQSKFIPYVIEIDKLGEAVAVKPALKTQLVDERVIRAYVAQFIADARLVTSDIALQRKAIFDVYALLTHGSPAFNKMRQWFDGTPESNPLKKAQRETVNVDITSALPLSKNTWQVDWIEQVHDRNGDKKKSYRMRANITVELIPYATGVDENQINRNPLGVYINDYYWTKQT
jgi:type IV secretion system protein TrbF